MTSETAPTHVRVDLSAVTFIDSTALSAWANLRNTALQRGGRVILRGAPPAVTQVLHIVGFDTVFTLEP